jgi:hypothetical protein
MLGAKERLWGFSKGGRAYLKVFGVFFPPQGYRILSSCREPHSRHSSGTRLKAELSVKVFDKAKKFGLRVGLFTVDTILKG